MAARATRAGTDPRPARGGGSERSQDSARSIGARLLAERRARNISARELARLAGVTGSLISQIETGKVNPSIGTMYGLAEALGITVDQFFAETEVHELAGSPRDEPAGPAVELMARPEAAEPPAPEKSLADQVVRRGDRHRITLAGGVQWELVYPADVANGDLEVISATYPPGTASSSEPVRHRGTEYGVVMEGHLDVEVAGERVTLGPGDSISFESMRPHRLLNAGSEVAQVMWVVRGRRGLHIARG